MIFLFSFFYGDFSRAAAAKKQKKTIKSGWISWPNRISRRYAPNKRKQETKRTNQPMEERFRPQVAENSKDRAQQYPC